MTEVIKEERSEYNMSSKREEQVELGKGEEFDYDSESAESSDDMDAQLIVNHPITDLVVQKLREKSCVKGVSVSSTKNMKPDRSLLASQT